MKESNADRLVQWGINLATLALIGMVIWYVQGSRLVSGHQQLVAGHGQNSMALAQLLQEASAYAQRDPSIIPLLNKLTGRPVPGPANASRTNTPNRR